MRKFGLLVIVLGLLCTHVLYTDGLYADEATNPISGILERVTEKTTPQGVEVLWQENIGGWQPGTTLTSNMSDDLDPRICISPAGTRFVLLWRDSGTPSAYLIRSTSSGWESEEVLSAPGQDSRFPGCAFVGGMLHFTFSVRNSTGQRTIAVGQTEDDDVACPGPNCPTSLSLLHTSSVIGHSIALQMHSDQGSGELWVDWVESTTEMAYSIYDPATEDWGAAVFVPISGGIETTRESIRTAVLGL